MTPALAYLLDALLGEPPARLHPVCWLGWLAGRGEAAVRRLAGGRPLPLRLGGAALVLVLVSLAAGAAGAAVAAAGRPDAWLGVAAAALVVWVCVARRMLLAEVGAVARLLGSGDLTGARARLAGLVGRETAGLSAPEVARAAVETAAENLTDAVVAPLFYTALGTAALGPAWGAALAAAHRAANTLDAMWGHRDEKYRHLGWAAARLDDVLNWLPARVAGALLLLAALPARPAPWDARRGWRTWRRDAVLHPSPNAGVVEAAAAGILGVRLGGANVYGGAREFRPYLGDALRSLAADVVREAAALVGRASHLAAMLAAVVTAALASAPPLVPAVIIARVALAAVSAR